MWSLHNSSLVKCLSDFSTDGRMAWNTNHHNVSQGLKFWPPPFHYYAIQMWRVRPGAEEMPRNGFQHSCVSCRVCDLLLHPGVDSAEALLHLLPATENTTHISVSHLLYFLPSPLAITYSEPILPSSTTTTWEKFNLILNAFTSIWNRC